MRQPLVEGAGGVVRQRGQIADHIDAAQIGFVDRTNVLPQQRERRMLQRVAKKLFAEEIPIETDDTFPRSEQQINERGPDVSAGARHQDGFTHDAPPARGSRRCRMQPIVMSMAWRSNPRR